MRVNIDKTIKYILMLLFFYCGQLTVINYALPIAEYSRLIMTGMFVVVIGIFAYYFVICHNTISFACIMCGSICIVNYVLSMVINRDWRGSYVLLVTNILTAVFFTAIFDRREFYEMYVNCMVFFSVIGIIATYGIVLFFSSYLPILQNTTGFSYYYNLFLAYPIPYTEVAVYRLNCIWTEPGVLAVYLMFALIFGLFFVKSGVVKNAILILAMVCTQSSTGYVLLILIMGLFVLKQILDNHKFSLLIVAVLSFIVIGITAYMLMPDAVNYILYKYQTNSISFIGRFAPMIYNMDMWTRSPLFGLGFEEGAFRVNYKIYRGVLFANTSTTTLLFHNFGFVLPIMSMLASWRLSRTVRERWIISFLLAAILILGVNFENQVLDQFYCIILFSVFMPMKEEKKNESIVA